MIDFPPRRAPRVSVDELVRYLGVALAIQFDKLPPVDQATEVTSLSSFILDKPAIAQLARHLRSLFGTSGFTVASLAAAADLISRSPMAFPPRGAFLSEPEMRSAWSNDTALVVAQIAISMWGQKARVFTSAIPLSVFEEAVRSDDILAAFEALIRTHLDLGFRRPNVVILTPLGGITDAQQESHLVTARAIETLLHSVVEVSVLVPGETMHPSTHTDEDGIVLYAQARAKVLDADFLIILAGNHESWGNASCVTWAEALNTPVLVFRDGGAGLSKVVSRSYFRTRVVPMVGAEQDAATVLSYLKANWTRVLARSDSREEFLGRMLPLMGEFEDLIAECVDSGLTHERLQSLLNNPVEIQTLSQEEIGTLWTKLGDRAHDLTRLLFQDIDAPSRQSAEEIHTSLEKFVLANASVTSLEAVRMLKIVTEAVERPVFGIAASTAVDGAMWVAVLKQLRRAARQ